MTSVSKGLMMYGGEGAGGIASSTNQLVILSLFSFKCLFALSISKHTIFVFVNEVFGCYVASWIFYG